MQLELLFPLMNPEQPHTALHLYKLFPFLRMPLQSSILTSIPSILQAPVPTLSPMCNINKVSKCPWCTMDASFPVLLIGSFLNICRALYY